METTITPTVSEFVVALIKDFEVRLQSLNAQVQSLAGQLRELKRRNASLPRSSDIPTFHNKKIGR